MKNNHILLIEEKSLCLDHVSNILIQSGYDVVRGEAINEEIVDFKNRQFDLIIIDAQKPVIPEDVLSKTPVLYLFSPPASFIRADTSYIYSYLEKPFTDRELKFSTEVLIERKTAQGQLDFLNRMLEVSNESNHLINSLYELSVASFETEHEILQYAITEAVQLTGGTIGCFHRIPEGHQAVSSSKWTDSGFIFYPTGQEMECFNFRSDSETDCIRQKKAVIQNQKLLGLSPNNDRHCLPEIQRQLWIPVIDKGCVVGTCGVFNKTEPFDEADVLKVQLFLDQVWKEIVHKRAEHLIRKLSRAVEHSPTGVVITDLEGKIEYVNPKYCQITGYTAAELINNKPTMLGSGETSQKIFQELYDTVLNGEQWNGKFHNRNKNGDLYWQSDSISPIFDSQGKITNFLGITENITTQIEEEQRLQNQLDFFQVLIEAIPVPIYYKNVDGIYLGCNNAFVKYLAERSEIKNKTEVIGKTVFDALPKEAAQPLNQKDKELIRQGGIQQFETQAHLGGKQRNTINYKAVITQGTEGWGGIVGTILDITERKEMEEELRRKLFELESVNRISGAFNNGKSLHNLMETLLGETLATIHCPSGLLLLYDEEYEELEKQHSQGWLSEINLDGVSGEFRERILKIREPYYIDDFSQDVSIHSVIDFNFPTGWSGAAFPIHSPQSTMGILLLAFEHPRKVTESEVQILQIITAIAGNAIQRTQLTEKLTQSNQVLQTEVELRRNMQDLLTREKELLSITLMSIQDGVICTDREGKISLFNRAAEEITGSTLNEAIGRPLEDVLHLIESHHGQPSQELFDKLKHHNRISGQDLAAQAPFLVANNGDRKMIDGSISTVIGENETIHGYIIVFQDITEKHLNEVQLVLAQKMEGIGQLAAGIAHEINTPIQYVGDNLNFLNRAFLHCREIMDQYEQIVRDHIGRPIGGPDFDQLQEFKKQKKINLYQTEIPGAIQESLDGIERVRKIVLAIREFSHPSEKEKSYADINHGIQTTITISRNEWKYSSEMEIDLEPDLPAVYCQIDEINQVILNMIINAAHAIQEVVSSQPDQKGLISIRTRHKGDRVLILIQDTGCGIPEGKEDRIFEPFFTTKEVGKGTGQGLYLAHNIIVKKHGGKIQVESVVGTGTTFTIELPIINGQEDGV